MIREKVSFCVFVESRGLMSNRVGIEKFVTVQEAYQLLLSEEHSLAPRYVSQTSSNDDPLSFVSRETLSSRQQTNKQTNSVKDFMAQLSYVREQQSNINMDEIRLIAERQNPPIDDKMIVKLINFMPSLNNIPLIRETFPELYNVSEADLRDIVRHINSC